MAHVKKSKNWCNKNTSDVNGTRTWTATLIESMENLFVYFCSWYIYIIFTHNVFFDKIGPGHPTWPFPRSQTAHVVIFIWMWYFKTQLIASLFNEWLMQLHLVIIWAPVYDNKPLDVSNSEDPDQPPHWKYGVCNGYTLFSFPAISTFSVLQAYTRGIF